METIPYMSKFIEKKLLKNQKRYFPNWIPIPFKGKCKFISEVSRAMMEEA